MLCRPDRDRKRVISWTSRLDNIVRLNPTPLTLQPTTTPRPPILTTRPYRHGNTDKARHLRVTASPKGSLIPVCLALMRTYRRLNAVLVNRPTCLRGSLIHLEILTRRFISPLKLLHEPTTIPLTISHPTDKPQTYMSHLYTCYLPTFRRSGADIALNLTGAPRSWSSVENPTEYCTTRKKHCSTASCHFSHDGGIVMY